MRSDVKVAVVIPCYNTGEACVDVIPARPRGRRTPCSSSTTARPTTRRSTSERHGAPCLRLPRTPARARPSRPASKKSSRAVRVSSADVFDYILTVDGDGQHDPDDIPRFVSLAVRERADFVIGVRNVRVMPPKSKIGNYFSRLVFFLGTGRYVRRHAVRLPAVLSVSRRSAADDGARGGDTRPKRRS